MTTFDINSGSINIGDPCYGGDTVVSAKNGTWDTEVSYENSEDWGSAVSVLMAWTGRQPKVGDFTPHGSVGVDSGQMSITDAEIATDCGESLYDEVCQLTLEVKGWGLMKNGIFSSTGYGDGRYPVSIITEDGSVTAIQVKFLDEDEEDE